MAITYWPKHGESNTEASFAAYADKLLGYADHASSDTAFMMQYTSTGGGQDTYTVTAGSYVLDGYVFTAAGTETVSVTANTATDAYLTYTLTDGVISACGIGTSVAGVSGYAKLWNLDTGNAAGAITDYRKVYSWGRQSYANADADCIDFLSAGETALKAGQVDLKSFRCAYPGTVYLDCQIYAASDAPDAMRVYRTRGGAATNIVALTYTINNVSTWETPSQMTVTGIQAGDYISIQGASPGNSYKAKNFRIRYKLTDVASAAVVVD